MPSGLLDTRCGDYGGPLPLRNLGSLAQAFKGGNTHLPGSIASDLRLCSREPVYIFGAKRQFAAP
jgi:hypothetical protein